METALIIRCIDKRLGQMEKAKELILTKYPNLKIKMILAEVAQNEEVEFKNIAD